MCFIHFIKTNIIALLMWLFLFTWIASVVVISVMLILGIHPILRIILLVVMWVSWAMLEVLRKTKRMSEH